MMKPAVTGGAKSGLAAIRQIPAYTAPLWRGRSQPWCVVVPVINEGERINRLIYRMAELRIDSVADIVIVDGGSTDGSLDAAALRRQGVRGLLVKTGSGRLSAQLRCAYAFALDRGYEGIITIDGNDKDDPAAVPRFIDELKRGSDFVQGSRFIAGGLAENTPWLREFAIRRVHAPLLSLCSKFRWTDTTQGFRAYSRRLLLDPRVAPFRAVFESYELLPYLSCRAPRLGYRCIEVPTARRYPARGGIPTKAGGLRGYFSILMSLINACRRRYDPSER